MYLAQTGYNDICPTLGKIEDLIPNMLGLLLSGFAALLLIMIDLSIRSFFVDVVW